MKTLEEIQSLIDKSNNLFVVRKEEMSCTNGESSNEESASFEKAFNIENEFSGLLRVEGLDALNISEVGDRINLSLVSSGHSIYVQKEVNICFID